KHHQVDCYPIEQTTHKPMFSEKLQLAAGIAIDYCSGDRDEVVEKNTKNPSADSTLHHLLSQQPAGNEARIADAHRNHCAGKVECAGKCATDENWTEQS